MLKQVAVRGIEPLRMGLKSVDLPLVDTATYCGGADGIRTHKAKIAARLVGGCVCLFRHSAKFYWVEAGGLEPPISKCQVSMLYQFNNAPTERRLTQSSEASLHKIHLLLPMFLNSFGLLLSVPHTVFRFFAFASYAGNFSSISFPCKGRLDSSNIRIVASAIDKRPPFSNGFLLCFSNDISSWTVDSSCRIIPFPVSKSCNLLYNSNCSLAIFRRNSNSLTIFSVSWTFLSKDSVHSFTCITPPTNSYWFTICFLIL